MTATTPEETVTTTVESRLSELERAELDVVRRFAAPERHISEDEVPWFRGWTPLRLRCCVRTIEAGTS